MVSFWVAYRKVGFIFKHVSLNFDHILISPFSSSLLLLPWSSSPLTTSLFCLHSQMFKPDSTYEKKHAVFFWVWFMLLSIAFPSIFLQLSLFCPYKVLFCACIIFFFTHSHADGPLTWFLFFGLDIIIAQQWWLI